MAKHGPRTGHNKPKKIPKRTNERSEKTQLALFHLSPQIATKMVPDGSSRIKSRQGTAAL
jgi:hypothetical protein